MGRTWLIVSAGDPSGDLYLSYILRNALEGVSAFQDQEVSVLGLGGAMSRSALKEMEENGLGEVVWFKDVTGLSSAIPLGTLLNMYKGYRILREFRDRIFESVSSPEDRFFALLIDFPMANVWLASELNKLRAEGRRGKLVYLVPPRSWDKVKESARRRLEFTKTLDLTVVPFPWNLEIIKEVGGDALFLGHPLLEVIEEQGGWRYSLEEKRNGLTLTVLLGSRLQEVKHLRGPVCHLLKLFLERADMDGSELEVRLVHTPLTKEVVKAFGKRLEKMGLRVVEYEGPPSIKALRGSDLAVVASGTATLETALMQVPALVLYKLDPISFVYYSLKEDVKRYKYISLVNLLEDEEVFPEFKSFYLDPKLLSQALLDIYNDLERRRFRLREFRDKLNSDREAAIYRLSRDERWAKLIEGREVRGPLSFIGTLLMRYIEEAP